MFFTRERKITLGNRPEEERKKLHVHVSVSHFLKAITKAGKIELCMN